ncbi:MAG: rhodanese-like domain-containing protein [Polyangiaceae bacterium]|nr:rhodanese-like domain-containing protein [Polyangiaceae bacterium]
MADELKRVSPEEAHRLMTEEGYIYVDVRTEAEWNAGHPVGAHNVPWAHAGPSGFVPNPEFLPVMQKLYEKNCPMVVGCKSGGRSLKASQALIAAGYTAVIDQRAGFEGPRDSFGKLTEPGWSPQGLPVEKETPGASYAELKTKASAT